jgi:hypothetical protein
LDASSLERIACQKRNGESKKGKEKEEEEEVREDTLTHSENFKWIDNNFYMF